MKTGLLVFVLGLAVVLPGHESSGQGQKALVKVRPFRTGVCTIGEDHLFGANFSAADRVPFVIYDA